jgi:predicted transcriptional regulator of viral defense system
MRDKTRAQREVAALATRQYGVVAAVQLAEAGYSRASISRAVAAGRLHRLHQGVYAVGHASLSHHGRCMAAVLACGDRALVSHGSAAWLWGLSTHFPREVDVTAGVPRHQQPGIRVHSAATLNEVDEAVVDGIPTTSVARTLLDLAATSRRQPGPALARANRRGLLDLIELDELLARSAGQRGVRRLRVALDDFRDPAFTRSGVERSFLRLVKDAGLPRPSTNPFVSGHELDAYWPELRFAVELDTYEFHGDARSFERDRKRQEDLKLAGIEMIRITGRRIDTEPRAVASRLRQLLDQRKRELNRH